MSNPVRQHYVPRCYLREFRDPLSTEEDARIYVFEKETPSNPRLQALENVCVSKHIYTIIDAAGNKDFAIEKALGEIEGRYAEVLKKIKARQVLTPKEHAHLCLFVATMLHRTLRQKDNLEGFAQQIVDMSKQMSAVHGGGPSAEAQIREMEEAKKNIHKENLIDSLRETAAILFRMNLGFVCAENARKRFITSDDPCHLHNPDLRWQRIMGPSLAQKNIELELPLTPDTMLVMSWQNYRGYVYCNNKTVDNQNRNTRGGCYKWFLCPVRNTEWYWFSRYPLEIGFMLGLIKFKTLGWYRRIKKSV